MGLVWFPTHLQGPCLRSIWVPERYGPISISVPRCGEKTQWAYWSTEYWTVPNRHCGQLYAQAKSRWQLNCLYSFANKLSSYQVHQWTRYDKTVKATHHLLTLDSLGLQSCRQLFPARMAALFTEINLMAYCPQDMERETAL